MATVENSDCHLEHRDKSERSPCVSPLKIRQILRDGFVSGESILNRSALFSNSIASSFASDAPTEATNKDAFFDRVESFSSLKWTGKPCVLSPLRCAQYGWINVDCDMLKCSSCQAFLCASIQPNLDFQKYEQRILQLTRQLQTQHENFCSWPDFPCPDRFWMVPVNEPAELFSDFQERFKKACFLQHQLPNIKPEQLKTMAVTEEVISCLLQLIEDEQKMQDESSSDPPNIQMAACTVALCGWEVSPGLHAANLPILSCTFCMRKVGLWNFQQLEGVSGEDNSSFSQWSTTEGRIGDRLTPTSPSQSPTPCRMKLRSQDSTRTEQSENTTFLPRTRSRDSPSPNEEVARAKRPLTRSRGQGENLTVEMPSSPQRKTKHLRLSSYSGPEGLWHRNFFDPVAQHRSWCPWVNNVSEECGLDRLLPIGCEMELPHSGWKVALHLFLTKRRSSSPEGAGLSQVPEEKSKRVFSMFQ